MRLALSKGSNRAGVSLPLTEEWDRSFSSYLQYQTIEKVIMRGIHLRENLWILLICLQFSMVQVPASDLHEPMFLLAQSTMIPKILNISD
jgi:hypothetical protein